MGFASKLLAAQNGRPGVSPYPSLPANNQVYNQQPQQQSYGAPGAVGNAYPNTSTGGNHYAPPSAPYQSQPQISQQQQSGYGAQYHPQAQQQQQPQYQQPQSNVQQQHYPPPPSSYPQQQQQQGQYQQGHQAHQSHSSASDPNVILNILRQAVQDQKLAAFFPQGSLEQLSQSVARSGAIDKLARDWNIPLEIAMDLAKLSLFNTVLYLDDSGSMQFEEGGSRIDDLKMIISKIAQAASLFDQDGIQVRFMNSQIEGNNITNESQVLGLVSQVRFSGLTPLGTELDRKVLQPLLLSNARRNALDKPLLVIVVTDGAPGGEDHNQLVKVILNANRELAKTRYGSDAVSFQLAQVGNDLKARAFLEELDSHREIGGLIDTTSNYENEADNMAKANPPIDLTPELWLVKLLLGPIDSSYDRKDEK